MDLFTIEHDGADESIRVTNEIIVPTLLRNGFVQYEHQDFIAFESSNPIATVLVCSLLKSINKIYNLYPGLSLRQFVVVNI